MGGHSPPGSFRRPGVTRFVEAFSIRQGTRWIGSWFGSRWGQIPGQIQNLDLTCTIYSRVVESPDPQLIIIPLLRHGVRDRRGRITFDEFELARARLVRGFGSGSSLKTRRTKKPETPYFPQSKDCSRGRSE
jgi:hypothetical protein